MSPDQATYLAPVFGAIRHIVDYASTLPVDAYRRVDVDTRQKLGSLPQVLRNENGPGRPGVGQWFGQAVYGLATQGNSVGWIRDTDGYGYPTKIDWLPRVDWNYDEQTGRWWVLGQPVDASNVFHIPWIVPTGQRLGLSPLGHAEAMVRAGLSAQDYADIGRGGGLPPSTLKNTELETIEPDASREIARRAAARFRKGEPFVVGKDWELDITEIPPNHVQFVETMKMSATQIAGIYGIDPREIGGDDGSSLTYKNDESRSLNRAANNRPYLVRIEDALERYLPERQFVRLNVDATIRTDIKSRVGVVGAQLKDGRLNVNEARALEDRGPVPGGDRYQIPSPAGSDTQPPATRKEDAS